MDTGEHTRAMNSKAVGHEQNDSQKSCRGKHAHNIACDGLALVSVTLSNADGRVVPLEKHIAERGIPVEQGDSTLSDTPTSTGCNRAFEVTVGFLPCPSGSNDKVKRPYVSNDPSVSKVLDNPTFRAGVVHPVRGT